MRHLTKISFMITSFLTLASCGGTDNNTTKNAEKPSMSFQFMDNGKAMDSLKNVYNVEMVEYENWEDDDASDSSFTVSFINSKKLPQGDVDANVNEFNTIAASIRNSLVKPDQYKSYYIIFVERDTVNGIIHSNHRAGMDVAANGL